MQHSGRILFTLVFLATFIVGCGNAPATPTSKPGQPETEFDATVAKSAQETVVAQAVSATLTASAAIDSGAVLEPNTTNTGSTRKDAEVVITSAVINAVSRGKIPIYPASDRISVSEVEAGDEAGSMAYSILLIIGKFYASETRWLLEDFMENSSEGDEPDLDKMYLPYHTPDPPSAVYSWLENHMDQGILTEVISTNRFRYGPTEEGDYFDLSYYQVETPAGRSLTYGILWNPETIDDRYTGTIYSIFVHDDTGEPIDTVESVVQQAAPASSTDTTKPVFRGDPELFALDIEDLPSGFYSPTRSEIRMDSPAGGRGTLGKSSRNLAAGYGVFFHIDGTFTTGDISDINQLNLIYESEESAQAAFAARGWSPELENERLLANPDLALGDESRVYTGLLVYDFGDSQDQEEYRVAEFRLSNVVVVVATRQPIPGGDPFKIVAMELADTVEKKLRGRMEITPRQ